MYGYIKECLRGFWRERRIRSTIKRVLKGKKYLDRNGIATDSHAYSASGAIGLVEERGKYRI